MLTPCRSVGYVEFVDLETVSKALGLTNTKLLGIPIIVQYTEAEKNRQARDNALGVPGQAAGLVLLLTVQQVALLTSSLRAASTSGRSTLR